METSFSLDFNPITNVKSVKDYECEIQKLRNENFQLKTQIAHSCAFPSNDNVPKILYEQNEKVKSIEGENNELLRRLEELKQAYDLIKQEKTYIENKYTEDMNVANEKTGFLEDENKRHLVRMDKFSKEMQEYRKKVSDLEKLNGDYKGFIENLESEIEQVKGEYRRKMDEYETHIRKIEEECGKSYNKINDEKREIEILKKRLENEIGEKRNNRVIIEDLKKTVMEEMNGKKRVEEELNKMTKEIKRTNEVIEKEGQLYMNGMEKFKKIVTTKLNGLNDRIKDVANRIERIKGIMNVSEENGHFLRKMNIEGCGMNVIVDNMRNLMKDARKKIEMYKKESEETQYFMKNNKKMLNENVVKLLEEFRKQFSEAKQELAECKKYLIKKAEENKLLKNENIRLIKELRRGDDVLKGKIIDPFSRKCVI